MRVLISSTCGYGHVLPMVPLARALVAAGHQVSWLTEEPSCALVRAAGLDAVPGGLDADGLVDVGRRLQAGIASLPGPQRAAFAFPHMFGEWMTPPRARDLLAHARQWQLDLLVHEPAELGAPLVAAILGVPYVTHSFGGAVPSEYLTAAGLLLADLWAAHGLAVPPYAGTCASYLDICPPSVQGQSLRHVGDREPLRPVLYTGEPAGPLPDVVLADDDRPLVYLTLGTVHGAAPVLSAAVDGLVRLGARVLVTVGPQGDPAALGPQPDSVRVERWVNQSNVLPRATAVVSHGGSGTFLGALACGLPQLCLPQAADQFRNAQALVRRGAGRALTPEQVTAEAVEQAVRAILGDQGIRLAAREVAAEIRAMPSPEALVPVLKAMV